MRLLKYLFRFVLIVIFIALAYGIHYCWVSFPIVSGYSAKIMCSAVFVSGRHEDIVRKEDLGSFPLTLGSCKVDYRDSSVTATVFGFAKRKAIFRQGLGATLIAGLSEEEIRAQKINLAIPPNIREDSVAWPMGDKIADTIPSGIDNGKLSQAVDHFFDEPDSMRPVRTRAVVVIFNGQLVAERYGPSINAKTRLLGWSMTKTATGSLIGLLAQEGKVNIDSAAPLPQWQSQDNPDHAITIRNLLQQSSGIDFDEDYTKSSDATDMLYKKADMGGFTASHPLKNKPGTVFYYSSGNSNILSKIIRTTVGDVYYYRFPYEKFFYKLGMYSATLEPDASGTFVGSSYMYATARDWARMGLMFLNDGKFNGEQILSPGWISQATTPAPAAKEKQYGFQIWLNAGSEFADAPADMFYADGYESQNVFVIPSRKLVVVRLGQTHYNNFDTDILLKGILDAIRN